MVFLKILVILDLICFFAALVLPATAGIIHLLFCEIEIDEEHKSFKARLQVEKRNFLLRLAGVFGILAALLFIISVVSVGLFFPANV